MTTSDSKSSYHHGDLRDGLLQAAMEIIQHSGIEGLSMRKLADRVGVSRTAPYHHFRDKQSLLSELALQGFRHYGQQVEQIVNDRALDAEQHLNQFVQAYLRFALQHPQSYELMFGQTLWKSGQASEALRSEAYACFQRFVVLVEYWQQQGVLPAEAEALRFAQVVWSMLHGLSRLVIDGIYLESSSLDAITETLLGLIKQQLKTK